MECGEYEAQWSGMAVTAGGIGLHLKFPGARGAPAGLARVPRRPARLVVLESPPDARVASHLLPPDIPLMSEMDEISYWIHTKRAPCLMNYDNMIKKQSEEAQGSKPAIEEVSSPNKRKKKRKLSMFNDDSSSEKQHNVYFEMAPRQHRHVEGSHKSDILGSDIDFNIKNTSATEKPKRERLQKNIKTKVHKKSKVVTSTPKAPVHLRRSLRQARRTGNNANLHSSFEVLDSMISNGHIKSNINCNQKITEKTNKSRQMFAVEDQTLYHKSNSNQKSKSKGISHPNGQFEDLSDVSGFTANYIRSTKVQARKAHRKTRCRAARTLVKESKADFPAQNTVVCLNKSNNTGGTNVLNCSTDSEQIVMNHELDNLQLPNQKKSKPEDAPGNIDKNTSLLTFRDAHPSKEDSKQKKLNLNVSFQSQSSRTSRYPKRYKNHTDVTPESPGVGTRRANKNSVEVNNIDKKENPPATRVSRTRSGRNNTLNEHPGENAVLVISNSTDQVGSMSINMGGPTLTQHTRKRRPARLARRCLNVSINKSGQSASKDSLRDKSGFAACFSESEDDSVPLVHRKYFGN